MVKVEWQFVIMKILHCECNIENHGEVIVSGLDLNKPEEISNTVGLNYRMTEMEAAVAKCQLKKLDFLNSKRIELADSSL